MLTEGGVSTTNELGSHHNEMEAGHHINCVYITLYAMASGSHNHQVHNTSWKLSIVRHDHQSSHLRGRSFTRLNFLGPKSLEMKEDVDDVVLSTVLAQICALRTILLSCHTDTAD